MERQISYTRVMIRTMDEEQQQDYMNLIHHFPASFTLSSPSTLLAAMNLTQS